MDKKKDWDEGIVKMTCIMCGHEYWATAKAEAKIKAGVWASICRDCSRGNHKDESQDPCFVDDSKQVED